MQPTLRAAFWMIGAIAAFTSMAIAGREAALDLDTFEIMLYRSCVGFVIVLVAAKACGTLGQVRFAHMKLHTARNLAHFTGQNLWFYALTVIPLAQVFALEFTSPIWVIILSPLILREKITTVGAMAAVVGFIGILIVARPGVATLNAGFIAAALCAIGFAFTSIFTRKLTRTETITSILFFLTGMQAVFGLVMAGYDGDIALPSMATLPWVVGIGFAGLIAHFCLTTALSIAPATIVMPMDFARLPIIAVMGIVIYAEPIDSLVIVGGALIFAANYVNIRFGQAKLTK